MSEKKKSLFTYLHNIVTLIFTEEINTNKKYIGYP